MYIDKARGIWTSNSVAAVSFAWIIIGSEYFIFTFIFLKRLLEISKSLTTFIFLEFHVFAILLLWSYIKTIRTGPGYLSRQINDHFSNVEAIKERQKQITKLKSKKNAIIETPETEPEQKAVDLEALGEDVEKLKQIAKDPILQLNITGYCFKCNAVKVPRAHHCRQCGRCVLRMDHHCPWIGNCVGKNNHKFFILTLIYASLQLIQMFFWEAIFYHFNCSNFREGLNSQTELIILVNSISSISVFFALGTLTFFQIYEVANNITTVEFHLKGIKERNPFYRGPSNNIESLFGTNRKEWLLPIEPTFPSEEEHLLLEEF